MLSRFNESSFVKDICTILALLMFTEPVLLLGMYVIGIYTRDENSIF